MGILLELIGSIGTLIFSSMKDVTEEEINKNIGFLEQYEWFQAFIDDVHTNKLILENDKVRHVIGKIDIEKMWKNSYRNKFRKKLKVVLQKQTSNLR
ncbi:hypothetical protein QTL97_16730 [Sporosarcina thermotolerans]|uniref:Uncharacterized protein n=1 Tax=Sporosarcina thermotolerans TaxID=633404 RepID=A0AAW9AFZ9_9BACL|nr:hypothetical protein [Sporosarcina thermotolerans]MDW0118573.1 hypothetical protein [Sporosarcina thermotolerans]WHT49484.1 hypothetical protein QNH10_08185 [Sporosarcina thermotolerans]